MQADHNFSNQHQDAGQAFRPAWAQQFLYSGAILVIIIAVGLLFGWDQPDGTSTSTGAAYVVALFGVWLVALPALQYALIRAFTTARPRLGWSTSLHPNVFGLLHAPGACFGRNAFAMVSALPALCMVLVLLPLAGLAWRQGVETVPEVVVVVAGGLSLHFLRYSLWALSQPRGTRVEVLEEEGLVRTVG